MTQAGLAKKLGISESNLMKKLRILMDASILKVRTSRDGIRTGEIMLTINPRLVFRGSDNAQARYTQEWYRPTDGLNDAETRIKDAPDNIAIAA
jgi:DNA-binding transcriptional regulator LsrR (DeoR family)